MQRLDNRDQRPWYGRGIILFLQEMFVRWLFFNLWHLKELLVVYFKYGIVGNSVCLEVSSVCQLRCPVCTTPKKGKMGILDHGYLCFKDFKKFVDTYPCFRIIEVSSKGEIFLNPDLRDIIEYAYQKRVHLTAYGGVNLNTISDEMCECLVKYRFKALQVAIDGASPETYRLYRQRGNFERVIENIEKINFYKRKFNSCFPNLIWQFVIFGHNEHELPKAKMMAEKLNMRFQPRLNRDPHYSPVKNKEFVRHFVGELKISFGEYMEEIDKNQKPLCQQLWWQPKIYWDGKLLGCCANVGTDFGNVFQQGLQKCIKNKKYSYARKLVTGVSSPRANIFCFYCPIYVKIRESQRNPLEEFRGFVITKRFFWESFRRYLGQMHLYEQ